MDNENVEHIHNRILFTSQEKNKIMAFAGKWFGTEKHTEWINPDPGEEMMFVLFGMWI